MTDEALERERRAIALFERLVDLPEQDRDGVLVTEAGADAALVTRVRSLLAADLKAALRTGAVADLIEAEVMPARIGAYRIEECIGRGGMGSVYRGARAAGDFEHIVAIKVIKPGLLGASLVARFRRERQLLAGLAHPHIARLYDGGEMPDGSPYLVMEHVDGLALTAWVDAHAADTGERVRLFLEICGAVAFAHRNLIVHRDLTPSNVLVTGDGAVKLIDFGIARPAENAGEARAEGPSVASLSLTPGYAAPERMVSSAVATSADIYSLGKILLRLLPADDAELRAVAARATATEPGDRYPTADALAADVAAWRDGFPVAARRGGRRYVAGKFVRRHALAVAAGVAALLLLSGALVYALVANGQAQRARTSADARFDDVRSLAGYMLFDLNADLARVPGNTSVRARLADRAQGYLAALAAAPDAAPALRFETARGLVRLAELQGVPNEPNLGERAKAVANLARADALIASLPAGFPGAAALTGLAGVYRGLIALHGDTDQLAARAALDRAERTLAAVPVAARTDDWREAIGALRIAQLDFADAADERPRIAGILTRMLRDREGWPAGYAQTVAARTDAATGLYYQALLLSGTDPARALTLHLDAESAFDALLIERRDNPLLLYRASWNATDGFVAGSQAGKERCPTG